MSFSDKEFSFMTPEKKNPNKTDVYPIDGIWNLDLLVLNDVGATDKKGFRQILALAAIDNCNKFGWIVPLKKKIGPYGTHLRLFSFPPQRNEVNWKCWYKTICEKTSTDLFWKPKVEDIGFTPLQQLFLQNIFIQPLEVFLRNLFLQKVMLIG